MVGLGKWDADELAQRLGNLDVTSVSLALMYWHMAGVIEPSERNTFELRESLSDTNQGGAMREHAYFQVGCTRSLTLHPDEDYEIELGIEEGDSEDREANAEMFWNVSGTRVAFKLTFALTWLLHSLPERC